MIPFLTAVFTDRRPGEIIVQGCKIFMWLAGLGWLAVTGGCQSLGGRGASASGVSPSFGQSYAPAQSEPPLEDAGAGRKSASRSGKSEASAEPENDSTSATAKSRSRLLPGNDKEPGQRKALPVSARTDAAADDDSLEL